MRQYKFSKEDKKKKEIKVKHVKDKSGKIKRKERRDPEEEPEGSHNYSQKLIIFLSR